MSDNVTSPVPSGTILATDDVGGVQYPRTKIAFGVDGVATDVSANSPLPTVGATNPAGSARTLAVSTNGGLVPAQAACTTIRTAVNAGSATQIDAARSGRIALQFQLETAATADIFISFSTTATATVYDLLIPSGTAKGDISFAMFAPITAISAFSSAGFTIATGSWLAV